MIDSGQQNTRKAVTLLVYIMIAMLAEETTVIILQNSCQLYACMQNNYTENLKPGQAHFKSEQKEKWK